MPETLPHNPRNAVTGTVERISWRGGSAVRKVLTRKNRPDTPVEWRASEDPTHFNYWRREFEVYVGPLAAALAGTGVRLPALLEVDEGEDEITLILEDVAGRTGADLEWSDFGLTAECWGQAQAALLAQRVEFVGGSTRFVRRYASSKPVNFDLLDDDSAWRTPLIRENWPAELRDGLRFLHAHQQRLFALLEAAPRWPSHLDFWPHNVIVTPDGAVVPIDWAFFGEGAPAEDIGNFVPDAIFDGFVSADRFGELEALMFARYSAPLVSAGLASRDDLTRMLHASAVKYVWLGPMLLARAGEVTQMGYADREIDVDAAHVQYRERGAVLLNLCKWAVSVVAHRT